MQTPEKTVFAHTAPLGNKKQINAAIEALFAQMPAAKRLTPHSKVLLKPNLLAKHAPQQAVTTHPDVLRGVILALQRRGVKNIMVADSPGGLYTPAGMRGVYNVCGLQAVCEQTNTALYTACESASRAANGRLVKQFTLLKPVFECDFIINLPKLKTHVLTGISGAVKNLLGLVPGLQKAEFHMRFPEKPHFGQMLVDLCENIRPDMHIVDGILGMEADGPGSGTPRQCDLLLAGEDPYSLDLALCRYMGIAPLSTPVLAAAHAQGLCAPAFDETLLMGSDAAKKPIPHFIPPRSYDGRVNFEQNVPAFMRPLVNHFAALSAPRPVIRKKHCIGCAKCAEICPQDVITLQNGKASIAKKNCIRCFCCHEMCPVKAVVVKRTKLFRL